MEHKRNIRWVTEADAASLAAIYAPFIDTPVTFETEVPSTEEFARRIREISAFYPYLVCEVDGRIVGYAYAHRNMERAAYQWNAELSLYVDKAFARQGIGRALFTQLIELLKRQHLQTLYSMITLPNEASVSLHRQFGFRELGVYRQTGFKCGQWHDVLCMDVRIASSEGEPTAPEPCRREWLH